MIETRAYNANRREFVALYDALRQETGCFMNLDLQRVATPTGAASMQHREGLATIISIEEQVKWLLEGRNAERIVVESLDDHEAFTAYTKLPVVHLCRGRETMTKRADNGRCDRGREPFRGSRRQAAR